MMRQRTTRHCMLAIGVLLLVRILWSWTYYGPDDTDQQMASLIAGHKDPLIRNFKPSSCVMVNGKCIPHHEVSLNAASRGLVDQNRQFFLDGQPFTILSGSFHYFRTHPAQWGDRLLKMKAAGLNTVMTYVPWNLHEKVRGQFNFTGLFNLPSFLRQIHQVGLKAIVRPGPYICSEWDFGGLPSWLLHDPNMVLRDSSYQPYLNHVATYFSQLLPLLANYQHKIRGGPIIAFQIENEFGSHGHDHKYMEFLKKLFEQYGLVELFFTSDGPDKLKLGTIPGVLATVNFKNNVQKKLDQLQIFQPDKPLMITEYWAGWFDAWGHPHDPDKPEEFKKNIKEILERNSSINFYMFEGGTNFGFWNGANMVAGTQDPYRPQVTSYDYDAPLSEAGDITDKFHSIRNLIMKLNINGPRDIPQVLQNTPKAAYGKFTVDAALSYEDLILLLPTDHVITLPDPVTMEYLHINDNGGQGYGWIMYRYPELAKDAATLKVDGTMADRVLIIVNGLEQKVIDYNDHVREIKLTGAIKPTNVLDILVENSGRVNYGVIDDQRKGIQGSIYIDGNKIQNWKHIPLEFNDQFIEAVSKSSKWKDVNSIKGPAIYRSSFDIVGTPTDTFLDMSAWNRGIVFLNKFNLGRYWNVGPTKTLYVPGPLLRLGKNEVLIFELHQPANEISFIDRPILGR